jgi:hypothetical protein
MKARLLLGVGLAALLILPQWSYAQEAEVSEAPDLSGVTTWEVNPADMGTFMAAVEKVVKAAGEADLPAEHGWSMWQDMYSITLVGQFMKAELDDPEHWMKQFMGTPGEATLMEAFQDFEAVSIVGAQSEIHQHMPAWSYMPEGMTEPPMVWVRVHEFWTKGGQENYEKWNALVGDFMAFFQDIGYPYPIWGNMVRYGDMRTLFVTAYDNPSDYVGDHSVVAMAEQQGKAEAWQGLLARLDQLTMRGEIADHQFLAAQSYLPELEETAAK